MRLGGKEMKKRVFAFLMAGMLLAGLMTGCGKQGQEKVPESTVGSSVAKDEEKELPTVKICMFSFADAADSQEVVAEFNKLTTEKIGAKVEVTFINFGSWFDQINLMLSGGGEVDMFPVFVTPLSSFVNKGQLMALDDLMEQYGSGIREAVDESYIECGRVDGKLYGITTNRDLAAYYGIYMRKDLCEKYNIDYENMDSLEKVEAALRVIKENEPDIYPLATSNSGNIIERWGWDSLGDDLGVLMDYGQNLDVVNLYETQEFASFVQTTRRWAEDGLIMPDPLNSTETGNDIIKAGKAFAEMAALKPGYEAQAQKATGYEIVSSQIIKPYAITSNVQKVMWTITNTCENPDKAMQILNMMYSDPEVSNLLIYGIEGKHYKIVNEADGVIGYPEGVTRDNTGYIGELGWAWPNEFIAYVWEGDEADIWQQQDAFNRNALKSKALGFVFNSEPVKTEYTVCTNVVAKYLNGLLCGALDPEEALPKFNQELKDAGIEKIIEEKQKQLDAWEASNK